MMWLAALDEAEKREEARHEVFVRTYCGPVFTQVSFYYHYHIINHTSLLIPIRI